MSGNCRILIFQAQLDKDVNTVFDMIPQYKIEYGGKSIIGNKSYMGKDPTWNDHTKVDHEFYFGPNPSGVVSISFESEGTYICDAQIAAIDLVNSKNAVKWYDSQRKGKKSGAFKMQAIYDRPEQQEEAKAPEGKKIVQPFDDPSVVAGMPVHAPAP